MRKKIKNIARIVTMTMWIWLLITIMFFGAKDSKWIYPFVIWNTYTFFLTWNVTSKLLTIIQIGLSAMYVICQLLCVNNGLLSNIYINFVYMMFIGLIFTLLILRLIMFALTYADDEEKNE